MRVRGLDANGDMQFGQGGGNFLANSPAAVAQNIDTRLGLWVGEWFGDVTEGTPWATDVLGRGMQTTRDMVIRKRILQTEGVTAIDSYSSTVSAQRQMSVSGVVETAFSANAGFDVSSGNPFTFDVSNWDDGDVFD